MTYTSQYVFAGLLIGCATFGSVFLLLGGVMIRAGTLPETFMLSTVWLNAQRDFEVVIAFERELVIDVGTSLTNIAALLLYSSIIASIGSAVPSWITGAALGFGLSLIAVAAAALLSVEQMTRKRTRQQNLYELIRQDQNRQKDTEYLDQRHPSFKYWKRLRPTEKALAVLWQAAYTAKWYWPREIKQ